MSRKGPTRRSKLSEEALGERYYQQLRSRKPNFASRLLSHWVDRLSGAASSRSFAGQDEQYASGRTTRDYVASAAGLAAWGMLFPILTIVTTQLVGAEQAGIFSLVFVTATLLMFLANYGVRTFQVSDVAEEHSFADYQVNRIITCVLMLIVGGAYCALRGYGGEMLAVSVAVYLFRAIDAFADVYEGRLQQRDKMYLAGLSQAVRSLFALVVFSAVLFVTRSLVAASVGLTVAALASLALLTMPLAFMETPRSRKLSIDCVVDLLQRCFPLFVALFAYNLVDNMPKFMMEGALSYDNQLYFNAIYFPAHAVLMAVSVIYRPLLLRLAEAQADPNGKRTFNLIMGSVLGSVVVVTLLMLGFMDWLGIPLLGLLYGLDFEQFRTLVHVMVVAGGLTAAIDFLYQVITIQRKQNAVMKLYLIAFVVSLLASLALINLFGLAGAVAAYALEMAVLFALLVVQIVRIRLKAQRAQRYAAGQ